MYRIATEEYEDHKSKVRRRVLSTERLLFAFNVFNITDKERAFSLLNRVLAVMNGEE